MWPWLVLAVLVAVVLTAWVTFTLTRLDRLHARVDAAAAALDAQLVRRSAALVMLAESVGPPISQNWAPGALAAARAALADGPADSDYRNPSARGPHENEITRHIRLLSELPDDVLAASGAVPVQPGAELGEAARRVVIARRFYNDAVRDTRSLRGRRMPRLLHLAGHRDLPEFFDIDDEIPRLVGAAG